MDIPRIIEATMMAYEKQPCTSIEAVIEADRWARAHADTLVTKSLAVETQTIS